MMDRIAYRWCGRIASMGGRAIRRVALVARFRSPEGSKFRRALSASRSRWGATRSRMTRRRPCVASHRRSPHDCSRSVVRNTAKVGGTHDRFGYARYAQHPQRRQSVSPIKR